MSVYEDIQARIDADKAADRAVIDGDTMEGACADIVGEILKIAEHWADKAEGWGPEETYVAFRDMVCQEVLETLRDHLWDE